MAKLGMEDVIKSIINIKKNIPNEREVAVVKKISKNKVEILLSNGNIETLKFIAQLTGKKAIDAIASMRQEHAR